MPDSGSILPAPAETPARPRLSLPGVTRLIFNSDGTIKWYDPSKDHCFVTLDTGGEAYLHETALLSGGFTEVKPGARVNCDVTRTTGTNRLQAFKVNTLDNSTARTHKLNRSFKQVTPETDWEMVRVKWFDQQKGFGFLTQPGLTQDIFVHIETVHAGGLPTIFANEELAARWGRRNAKGDLTASHIRSIQER